MATAPRKETFPLDRAIAFLDPLLASPAVVTKGNNAIGWTARVRYYEADARIKFSTMPLARSPREYPQRV